MKRIWKITKWLGGILIALVFVDAGLVLGFALSEKKPEKAGAIIVLGAAINSVTLYNRSLEALDLYKQDLAPVLVLSGGRISNEDISEAGYMQKVILRELWKQSQTGELPNMVLEENSHSTYENIKNSRAKIPEVESVIIVTDNYHVARSVLIARRAGFKNVYWSTPGTKYSARELLYHFSREMLAMAGYIPKFITN